MEKEQAFNNVIKLNGMIDEKLYENFDEACQRIIDTYNAYMNEVSFVKDEFVNPFPEIRIDINSPGGYTSIGCGILDKMQELKDLGIKLHTRAMGSCMSMAFIIYLFADKRSCGKFVRFMNHGSSGYHGGYLEEAKTSIENETEVEEMFESIIYQQTNMPKERVEKARNRTDFFGEKVAIELGVVNYYEGSEMQRVEEEEKVGKAIESSVNVFGQILGIQDEKTSIELMAEILNTALDSLNPQEETKDISECFKTQCEECEDKEECLEGLLVQIAECKTLDKCEECEDKEECKKDIEYINNLLGNKKMANDKPSEVVEKETVGHKCDGHCDNCTCETMKIENNDVEEDIEDEIRTTPIYPCNCEKSYGNFEGGEKCKDCKNVDQCVEITLKEIAECQEENLDSYCNECSSKDECNETYKLCCEYLKSNKEEDEE